MSWQTDIGLEIHVQLQTKSKLFSNASSKFGSKPNASTTFVDAGLPGTLPVLNQEAVQQALKFAIASSATINNDSYFERKNYFYPDLPKGYQITQNRRPIMINGQLKITLPDSTNKTVHIHHAHLEEDAGKLIHNKLLDCTLVDLNRAGNPLLEIVTTPCMKSAIEAVTFLKELHRLVRFIDICDGNMQEGSFRCDVNISIRKSNTETLGTKAEIKNLNSFKFIEKAINYEIARQQELLEDGKKIQQETRLYCTDTHKTFSMRSKETVTDYRYFLEPDLRPIHIEKAQIEKLTSELPKLPWQIKHELEAQNLNQESVEFLLSSASCYKFYKQVTQDTQIDTQQLVNWLKGQYTEILKEQGLTFAKPSVNAHDFAILMNKLASNEVSKADAKKILHKLANSEQNLQDLFDALKQQPKLSSTELQKVIAKILEENPKQVAEYQAGKDKLLAFFVGQTLKATKGQAAVGEVNKLIKDALT